MARMIDLTNKKYGKLTVIKLTGERGPSGQIYWECKCDCGNIHVTSGESLRGGKSKSCGCARKTPPNKAGDREYAIKKQLYKTNVEKRSQRLGFDYNISLEDYIKLIEQPCFYCGIKDSNYATDRYNTKKNGRKTSDTIVYYNGIDRIDSSKGYVKGNVVTSCKYCNTAKNTMTQQEFKEWIVRVYEHYCK